MIGEYLMKNVIRGGAILLLISMFVVFIYAQTRTGSTHADAAETQATIETNTDNNNLRNTTKADNNIEQSVSSQPRNIFGNGLLFYRTDRDGPACPAGDHRRRPAGFETWFDSGY
jgi:hypothetical protein